MVEVRFLNINNLREHIMAKKTSGYTKVKSLGCNRTKWSKQTYKMLQANKQRNQQARDKLQNLQPVLIPFTTVCPPRQTPRPASLNTDNGVAVKKNTQFYTGDNIKGIGPLQKSNAVPVFTDAEAKDQATMRR